jgi:hypothetical protein
LVKISHLYLSGSPSSSSSSSPAVPTGKAGEEGGPKEHSNNATTGEAEAAAEGAAAEGGGKARGSRVLPNLEFVEGDMAEVGIDPGAFVASVHGES